MNIKEVYTALESTEQGADLISAIKGELNRTRNEAKSSRENYDGVMKALGLQEGEDAAAQVQSLKQALDDLEATGKKPGEAASAIAKLTKQVDDLTKANQAEKAKSVKAIKVNKAMAALQAGQAVSPENICKLIENDIIVKDDDSVVYMQGGNEVSLDEGVKSFLTANPWAVQNGGKPGGGTGAPNGGGKIYTQDDLATMSPAEINEHWEDIKTSAKSK